MEIEQLCNEFHIKIGLEKKLKITIEEGDIEVDDNYFKGVIKIDNLKDYTQAYKPKPFLKILQGNGIIYHYLGSSKSTIK